MSPAQCRPTVKLSPERQQEIRAKAVEESNGKVPSYQQKTGTVISNSAIRKLLDREKQKNG